MFIYFIFKGRVTRPGLATNAELHSVERGVGLEASRMLTGISLFVHAVRQNFCYASAKARYSERCVSRLDASLSPVHW